MRIKTDSYTTATPEPTNVVVGKGKEKAGEVGADHVGAGHDSVKVTVSHRARELAAGAMDEAKVARLRDAVNAGSLKIDAQAIANKIVGDD